MSAATPAAAVTPADWERRQHRLNLFTDKYLSGVGAIREDGDPGPATQKRIQECKWWLGWETRTTEWSDQFANGLRAPRDPRVSSGATVARGVQRRAAHNVRFQTAKMRSGVTTWGGVTVAAWMVPYLQWAQKDGWPGGITSGWRSPAYSESLCKAMCGQPRCPGKCAGRSSNHSGKVKPAGAIDVTFFDDFGQRMKRCPLEPKLQNLLGAQDPVHFSVSGR